jgi:hypothetical protein
MALTLRNGGLNTRVVACRGKSGALIEGVQYRKKGSKHSIADRQAWWCEAPPRTTPLLDKQARILTAEKRYSDLTDKLSLLMSRTMGLALGGENL